MTDEKYYSPREVAKLLGFQYETVRGWAKSYPGFATKVGTANRQIWRIPESSLRLVTNGVPVDQLPPPA